MYDKLCFITMSPDPGLAGMIMNILDTARKSGKKINGASIWSVLEEGPVPEKTAENWRKLNALPETSCSFFQSLDTLFTRIWEQSGYGTLMLLDCDLEAACQYEKVARFHIQAGKAVSDCHGLFLYGDKDKALLDDFLSMWERKTPGFPIPELLCREPENSMFMDRILSMFRTPFLKVVCEDDVSIPGQNISRTLYTVQYKNSLYADVMLIEHPNGNETIYVMQNPDGTHIYDQDGNPKPGMPVTEQEIISYVNEHRKEDMYD